MTRTNPIAIAIFAVIDKGGYAYNGFRYTYFPALRRNFRDRGITWSEDFLIEMKELMSRMRRTPGLTVFSDTEGVGANTLFEADWRHIAASTPKLWQFSTVMMAYITLMANSG